MNENDKKQFEILKNRDAKRKQNVKLYFLRRNAKIDFYKTYFEKHATNDDKKTCENIAKSIKL